VIDLLGPAITLLGLTIWAASKAWDWALDEAYRRSIRAQSPDPSFPYHPNCRCDVTVPAARDDREDDEVRRLLDSIGKP